LSISIAHAAALLAAAVVAGGVNSIAGGGTLFTFPTLLAVGVPPLTANGTSTVALVPGSAAAAAGYRRELTGRWGIAALLGAPSLAGGAIGASLTLRAGDTLFARLVPWLILLATILFLLHERISARITRTPHATPGRARLLAIAVFQLLVATYGGFFGAGMGILILAALAQAGFTDVHEMNALKSIIAVCINGTATVTFILGGRVIWPLAALMAAGAIAGGYGGAILARRAGRRRVRQAIVVVGFGLTALLFARQL